jgi:hypothetical protein
MSKGMIEFKAILGYLEGGITSSFHLFDHEQYPFNSVIQNDSTHGVLSI